MKKKSNNKVKPQKWATVPIEEEFLANDKEFANLVSFEVLTDYKVTREEDNHETVKLKTRKRKEICDDSTDSETEENDSNSVFDASKINEKSKNKKKPRQEEYSNSDNTSTHLEQNFNLNTSIASVCSTSAWEVSDIEPVEHRVAKKAPQQTAKQAKKTIKKKKPKVISNTSKEVDSDIDVDPMESDSFSFTEWAKLGVPEIILKALKENSFDKPTPIQMLTLPASILGRKDVVGAAETGSGKTLAFAIPIINGILRDRNESKLEEEQDKEVDEYEKPDGVQTLILTPTRELAVQIKRHIEAVAKYTNVKVVVIVGGLAAQKQERLLRGKPEIVIATPGRLWELVKEGNEHLSTLNKIRYLAVDETDRMVEKGHFQELQGILEVLNSRPASKNRRQNFVFSATLAFTHEPPKRFKKTSVKTKKNFKEETKVSPQQKLKEIMEMVGVRENAKIVDITSGKGTCETLTEMSISCQLSEKDYYLYYFFVRHPGRTIVFCNSINCVRRLVNLFFLLKCETFPLHSEMQQKQRLRNLERFTADEKAILIATDVAARGLDITNIEHVIHYQIPRTAESYIHRSGRTARAFKGGIAIALVEPAETSSFWNISRSLGRKEMLPSFKVDSELFNDIKARVNMGIKVEKIEHSVRKELADMNWMEKAKKDLDLASSEEESDQENDDGGQNSKKSLQKRKKELDSLKEKLSQMLASNPLLLKKYGDVPSTLNKMALKQISIQ